MNYERLRAFQSGFAGSNADAGEAVDASAAESIACAFEGEDVGVVDDAVDHRCCDGLVAEYAAPAREWQIGGEDQ